jgi:subtilisin family serine protease
MILLKSFFHSVALVVASALLMATSTYAADVENALRATQDGARAQVILRLKQPAARAWNNARSVSDQKDVVESALSNATPELDALGVKVETRFATLPYITTTVDRKQLVSLLDSAAVDGVYLNYKERKVQTTSSSVERASLASSVPSIDVANAWAKGYDGRATTIAVIDGGFRTSHPMLSGRVIGEACFSANDPTFDTYTRCPSGQTPQLGAGAASNCPTGTRCDHGTHVASIAMGNDGTNFGVAREARLLPIDVFSEVRYAPDCSPDPAPCELTDSTTVLKALDFVNQSVAQFNIVAVNLSLGGRSYESYCDTDPRREVIDMLRAKGVATVVATGNEAQSTKINAPSCVSSAVAVGATDDAVAIPASSNLSSATDLVAPGVNILAASGQDNGLKQMSGTSMSAPHVAGAIAVMRTAFATKGVDEIEQALKVTGLRATRDGSTYYPKIQVNKAILRLQGRDIRNFNNVTTSASAAALGQAYVRLQNDSEVAGVVTITLRDADTGGALGVWTSPSIAPHASVQYDLSIIERAARLTNTTTAIAARKFYNLDVESTMVGYMQHIVWARSAGILTNLTACADGLSNENKTLINVHSKLVEGYPSYIRIANTGVVPAAATLTFYNSDNGRLLGTYTTAAIAGNGSSDIAVSAIEAAVPALQDPSVAGASAVAQYNVTLSGMSGYLQHVVANTSGGVLVDMSAKCNLGVR